MHCRPHSYYGAWPGIVIIDILDQFCISYCNSHDYYSIWFNLSAAFFKSEKTTGVIKLKTHYFISNHFMKC
jgi:hypothetical protein